MAKKRNSDPEEPVIEEKKKFILFQNSRKNMPAGLMLMRVPELKMMFKTLYPPTKKGWEILETVPKQRIEDLCSKCGECCSGHGLAKDNTSRCEKQFESGLCAIYHSRPKNILCFSPILLIKQGTFPYFAPRGCAYWDLFKKVTDTEVL